MYNYLKILVLIAACVALISCSKRTIDDLGKKVDTTSKTLGRDVDTVVSKIDTAIQKITKGDTVFNNVKVVDVDESKLSDKDFRKNLNDVFDQSTDIKDELVDDDSSGVNKQAKELKDALGKVRQGAESQTNEGKWSDWVKSTDKIASQLETNKDLNQQRTTFKQLSAQMETLVKTFGLNSTTVYKVNCPKDKTYWFTETKSTKNPFYGRNKDNKECAAVVEAWKFD